MERKSPMVNTATERQWRQGKPSLRVDNSLQGGCERNHHRELVWEKPTSGGSLLEATEGGKKDVLEGDERDVGLQKDTARGSDE